MSFTPIVGKDEVLVSGDRMVGCEDLEALFPELVPATVNTDWLELMDRWGSGAELLDPQEAANREEIKALGLSFLSETETTQTTMTGPQPPVPETEPVCIGNHVQAVIVSSLDDKEHPVLGFALPPPEEACALANQNQTALSSHTPRQRTKKNGQQSVKPAKQRTKKRTNKPPVTTDYSHLESLLLASLEQQKRLMESCDHLAKSQQNVVQLVGLLAANLISRNQ